MDNEPSGRISRIEEMERLYDEASKAVANFSDAFEKYLEAQDEIARLAAYYESFWRGDFEADERGELPRDLKRGVLSEDAIYDLLTENDFCFGFIKLPDGEE